VVKILETCAALERWEWRRDGVDHRVDRVLPDEIGVVHACLLGENPRGLRAEILDAKEPVFATHGVVLDAACGRWLRVLLPEPFNSEHPKACPQCLDAMGLKGG
jgi:hypothetical protein